MATKIIPEVDDSLENFELDFCFDSRAAVDFASRNFGKQPFTTGHYLKIVLPKLEEVYTS